MQNKIVLNANNLIYNLNLIKQQNPSSLVCAMVKANAYGHGLKQVVSVLSGRVDFFGVANSYEAKLVKKYTDTKILIVGALDYIGDEFSYTCFDVDDVKKLASLNKNINIHLKVNTGMNRYGFKTIKSFKTALEIIKNSALNLQGVFTHFATSDSYVKNQYLQFKKFMRAAKSYGFNPIFHADNSAVNLKFNHNLNMVRVGFSLYGLAPPNKPVFNLLARVQQINSVKKGELVGYDRRFTASKPTNIAVISLGYADGLDLKYIGMDINIKNSPCKIVNICMDCCMLDIGNLKLKKGSLISIIGKANPIINYSNYINTSPYQVACHFGWARANRLLSPVATHHKNHK